MNIYIATLVEAAAGYEGRVFAVRCAVDRLPDALLMLTGGRGARYRDSCSWDETVRRYEKLFGRLGTPDSLTNQGLWRANG